MSVDGIMKNIKLESVKDLYKRIGAKYLAPIGPWDNITITESRVVTGVNAASASDTAKRSVMALK